MPAASSFSSRVPIPFRSGEVHGIPTTLPGAADGQGIARRRPTLGVEASKKRRVRMGCRGSLELSGRCPLRSLNLPAAGDPPVTCGCASSSRGRPSRSDRKPRARRSKSPCASPPGPAPSSPSVWPIQNPAGAWPCSNLRAGAGQSFAKFFEFGFGHHRLGDLLVGQLQHGGDAGSQTIPGGDRFSCSTRARAPESHT